MTEQNTQALMYAANISSHVILSKLNYLIGVFENLVNDDKANAVHWSIKLDQLREQREIINTIIQETNLSFTKEKV